MNVISVNFDPSDANLTSLLNKMSGDSWNFTNNVNLVPNLEWALLQGTAYNSGKKALQNKNAHLCKVKGLKNIFFKLLTSNNGSSQVSLLN